MALKMLPLAAMVVLEGVLVEIPLLVQVLVEDPEPMLWHAEVIYRDNKAVGYVRAGSYGHTLGGAVGLAEGLSAARLFAAQGGYYIDSNREFVATGASNVLAGLSGGLGVAGSLSKGLDVKLVQDLLNTHLRNKTLDQGGVVLGDDVDVSISLGAMAFTLTPLPAHSFANAIVSCPMPPLLAA